MGTSQYDDDGSGSIFSFYVYTKTYTLFKAAEVLRGRGIFLLV